MSSTPTHYEVLGVDRNATPADVRAAYQRVVGKVHPDAGLPPAMFRQVHEAYEVLSDAGKRRAYDAQLAAAGAAAGAPNMGSVIESQIRDAMPTREQVVGAVKSAGGAFLGGLFDRIVGGTPDASTPDPPPPAAPPRRRGG